MINPKRFRNEIDDIEKNLARRSFCLDKKYYLQLEEQRKSLQISIQALQNEKKMQSKRMGQLKAKGETSSSLYDELTHLSLQLSEQKKRFDGIQSQLQDFFYTLPNLLSDDVPDGTNEKDNQEIRQWGDIPHFDFEPKDHVTLGENLGGIDFSASAKLSGSRFSVMKSGIAKLHRVLIQFMLDTHIEQHDYQETYVPYLVNAQSLFGSSQLPKFSDDLFRVQGTTQDGESLYLIPTAEVPLVNMVRDSILDPKLLPMKLTAHTPCFRSEAGSYGKDVKGLIRQHQFEKIELVQIVHPSQANEALESLTQHAEHILKLLKLPFRTVLLCSGDTGFGATKTYDIEVWLPAQKTYREISSCSNMGDFQARRMQARWRNPETGKPELLHTLNGSALAVGRTLVAILENYQQASGHIKIPEVLRKAMNCDEL
jgi:seryl-tRNA synthetase